MIDEDDHLLELLEAGDRRALLRATRLITARLRRLGAYDIRDEWDDICQETIWALVRAVRDGRAPSADRVSAYVSAIVRNQFVSWLRRRDSRPETTEFEETTTTALQDSIKGETGLAPEDSYAAKQALSRLPEDWQVLLVARYVDGRTIDTLVSASGRSRASVNRDLKRARAAFRGELFAEADDDNDDLPNEGEEDLR